MEAAAASAEIAVLGWSIVLLFIQVVLPSLAAKDLSYAYLAGARDDERRTSSVTSRRLRRALHNLLETYPAFVALALGLAVTGQTGGLGALGAWLWLAARVVYVPLYAAGIPLIRSIVWFASMAGLAMMLIRLVF